MENIQKMKLLDLFSGIGGFHLGLEQAGFKFDWVGYSEIDRFANRQYKKRFPKAQELGDVTTIQPRELPKDITILCGGFPCQAFSIAGKRQGFDDTRGTLFFEIARILRYFREIGKPIPYFILENVKGLLNHDNGRTFATIYGVLTNLDYTIECQLLNTRWFLPQNRERIYIVGHFRGESRRKVFPIGGDGGKSINEQQGRYKWLGYSRDADGKKTYHENKYTNCVKPPTATQSGYVVDSGLKQIGTIGEDSEATRVYDPSGCGGGMGVKTGLYQVKTHNLQPRTGDPNIGGTGHLSKEDGTTYCLDTGNIQAVEVTGVAHRTRTYMGQEGHIEERDDDVANAINSVQKDSMVKFITRDSRDNSKPGTSGSLRASRTLELGVPGTSIRRLTPTECERLQGFPDGWTEGQSDTQRYKQLGNAVSVPVVKAVGERIVENLQ